jgi:hypothetical protein
MKPLTTIIAFLLISSQIFGQRELTKEEIFKYWNLTSGKNSPDANKIVNSSNKLNVYLTELIDSLQAKKIDSVIIFSTALPGYSSLSKCDSGMFPVTAFILWNKENATDIKKIKNNCTTDIKSYSLIDLFGFYDKNRQKIESEVFMPVILSGQMNKDKTVSYTWSSVDHEPVYSFYYKIGNHKKVFHFTQSDIENKKSLFHEDNLGLAAYHWWQLIKQEIDKID